MGLRAWGVIVFWFAMSAFFFITEGYDSSEIFRWASITIILFVFPSIIFRKILSSKFLERFKNVNDKLNSIMVSLVLIVTLLIIYALIVLTVKII